MKAIEIMRKAAEIAVLRHIPNAGKYKSAPPIQQQNYGFSREIKMLPAWPGAKTLQMIDYVTGERYSIVDLDTVDDFSVQ